jgi:hypothetical protein
MAPPSAARATPARASVSARRVLGTSARVYLHRWRPHLAASMIAQAPVLVPILLVVDRLVAVLGSGDLSSPDALVPISGLTILLLLLSFASAFLFVLMSAAACQLVEFWLNGGEVRLLAAYSLALRRFWRLAAAMGLVFLGISLAIAAFCVVLSIVYFGTSAALQVDAADAASDPRLALTVLVLIGLATVGIAALLMDAMVRWAVYVQVVMIEHAGPVAALRRSAWLVRGRWWRTAWVMSALMVVPLLLMAAVSVVCGALLGPLVSAGLLTDAVANHASLLIGQLALSPLAPIGVTILFYALREGDLAWGRVNRRLG